MASDSPDPGRSVNLPNAITLGRVALVPVIVLAMLDAPSRGPALLPAALVVVAALSDALDGHLARRQNLITDFGKLVDPIADKALIIAALAVLVVQDRVAAWVAVAIVVRELAVTILRSIARRRGAVVSASRLGKNKATVQIVTIVVLILASDPSAWWVLVLVYAAVAITLISGVQYFVDFRRRLADTGDAPSNDGGPSPTPR